MWRRCGPQDRWLLRAGSRASAPGAPWSRPRWSTRQPSSTTPAARLLPSVRAASGTDSLQDRLKHILVLLDRLGRAAVKPVREPVLCGLPYGVMGVTGLRDDPFVEILVQLLELVHDGGLGLAADLPPVALSAFGIPERYLTAPQPRAVPVAFRVA